MSRVISVRLPEELVERLRERASVADEHISGLAQRLVDEGLRMEEHPGVVFGPGPSGRRARLVRGPDIWEVVALVRSLESRGSEAVSEASEWLDVSESEIRAALSYYGEFPEEIDARIASNERVQEKALRQWEAQQELLA